MRFAAFHGRAVARAAVIALGAVLLAGCVSLGARLLLAVVADPRTRNHDYYARIEITFRMGNKLVKATRFADVGYLSGKGSQSLPSVPDCERADRNCWYITDHYFLGLPGGDIVDVALGSNALLPLPDMLPGRPVAVKARLLSFYRDQPQSKYASEFGPCLTLDEETVTREYGLAYDRMAPATNVDVVVTRLEDRRAAVFDPDDFYRPKTLDGVSCKRLWGRVSGGVTVTEAP